TSGTRRGTARCSKRRGRRRRRRISGGSISVHASRNARRELGLLVFVRRRRIRSVLRGVRRSGGRRGGGGVLRIAVFAGASVGGKGGGGVGGPGGIRPGRVGLVGFVRFVGFVGLVGFGVGGSGRRCSRSRG